MHTKVTKRDCRLINEVGKYVYKLLGVKYTFRRENKYRYRFFTGTRFWNQFIYTIGDCARFALLLHDRFKRKHPEIYLIRYPDFEKKQSKFNWHHALCKIGKFYFDAFGFYNEEYVQLHSDYIGPMRVRNLKSRIFEGNLNSQTIDLAVYTHTVPYHDFTMDFSSGTIEIIGDSEGGYIDYLNCLYKYAFKNFKYTPEKFMTMIKRQTHRRNMSFDPIRGTLWNRYDEPLTVWEKKSDTVH